MNLNNFGNLLHYRYFWPCFVGVLSFTIIPWWVWNKLGSNCSIEMIEQLPSPDSVWTANLFQKVCLGSGFLTIMVAGVSVSPSDAPDRQTALVWDDTGGRSEFIPRIRWIDKFTLQVTVKSKIYINVVQENFGDRQLEILERRDPTPQRPKPTPPASELSDHTTSE